MDAAAARPSCYPGAVGVERDGVHGTLPDEGIAALIEAEAIASGSGIDGTQVQPASLDLSLGEAAWWMPGSVLPLPGEPVEALLERFARCRLDLSRPEVFVRGQVYVVRLDERLALPEGLAAYANGKSSIGRIDVQTRVLTDENPRYDKVPPGYRGPLYLEVIPKSFDIRVRAKDRLNQAIFYRDRRRLGAAALAEVHGRCPLVRAPGEGLAGFRRNSGLLLTLDLEQPVVGWVAKRSLEPIDLAQVHFHDPSEYFDPIPKPRRGALFLSREAFYIFSTHERVVVPPELAAEMLPYDTSAGEFRAHYAGFFDPGFGWGAAGELGGTPAVLEVRPYEDDLLVRHRQPVCKMAFEQLTAAPRQLYGQGQSHYAEQRGPRLSKYFEEISP